jgi:adenylyltransferase/sulfurtransferase
MSPADELPPIEVSCFDVKQKLDADDPFLFVDCREPDEYDVARISSARLVPMSEIERRLRELEPFRDRPIVVHCHHGGRSLRVAEWLRERGFKKASSMAGGIDRWSEEIDPSVPRY